jgi:hypothetical protein
MGVRKKGRERNERYGTTNTWYCYTTKKKKKKKGQAQFWKWAALAVKSTSPASTGSLQTEESWPARSYLRPISAVWADLPHGPDSSAPTQQLPTG